MAYVITCGDEGVQINEGVRIAVVGAGFRLEGFSQVTAILKSLLGADIMIAASEENDWVKEQLSLANWEQTNASAQQHTEALADREHLSYAGMIPFTDPKQLEHGIKAHMVRPHGIHIANKICFTLGGGEQTFNLGCYLISADWVADAPTQLISDVIEPQIAFYKKLAKRDDLEFVFELGGELGDETALRNKQALEKAIFKS
ncbi:hypothetical protein KBC79_02795 [Candidatus Woesebacteria bacterium]|nr:hypothetical protein [Candidatus Woesebacteria bacterium]